MMQFRVPQNIDLEDKIVGPLTLVQFSELVGSGMVFYLLLRSGNSFLFVVVGIPVLLLGLALAFVKIQDQPFSTFIVALVQYAARPKLRIWKKDASLERLAVPMNVEPLHHAEEAAAAQARRERHERTVSQLDQLAHTLDTSGEAAVAASGGVTAKTLGEALPAQRAPVTVPVTASKNSAVRIQNSGETRGA